MGSRRTLLLLAFVLATAADEAAAAGAAAHVPDHAKALDLSLTFYQAQRSGKLPDRSVPWRFDAFVNERTRDGKDVSGGYFDAGDHVRFMLPQATALTIIAQGLIEFKNGYLSVSPALHRKGLSVLKWGADFLHRCVLGRDRIVGQIGLGGPDHALWVRPDEIRTPYPVLELGPGRPGADVAGSMAAALAAASIALNSSVYLASAETAFAFGARYPGFYHVSIGDASGFYKSTSQYDDLALGAAWLYRATRKPQYLRQAKTFLDRNLRVEKLGWPSVDWDNVQRMAMIALSAADPGSRKEYAKPLDEFRISWLRGQNGVRVTPRGLRWLAQWGPLRYNGNALYAILVHAKTVSGTGSATYRDAVCFARTQIAYMLGDGSPRRPSYMVGYGSFFPRQPHHRAASCPSPPTPCGWEWFGRNASNPHVLVGAVVGGPGVRDQYVDRRDDYISNEVAIDYNAGVTSALAALLEPTARSIRCG